MVVVVVMVVVVMMVVVEVRRKERVSTIVPLCFKSCWNKRTDPASVMCYYV